MYLNVQTIVIALGGAHVAFQVEQLVSTVLRASRNIILAGAHIFIYI